MLLLNVDLPKASVDTTIQLWEVGIVVGAGIWALVKLYFKVESQDKQLTLLSSQLVAQELDFTQKIGAQSIDHAQKIKDCVDDLKQHKIDSKSEVRAIAEANRGLSDVVIRLDTSVQFMTQAVQKLTTIVETRDSK
jgi:hypothetical protein